MSSTERWYGPSDWFSLPRAIRYDDRLSHADFRVLLAIASHDMKGGEIYPPRWQLQKYTGITESNISKRTEQLATLGWLEIVPMPGKVNRYILKIPEYVLRRQKLVAAEVKKESEVRALKKRDKQKQWAVANADRCSESPGKETANEIEHDEPPFEEKFDLDEFM